MSHMNYFLCGINPIQESPHPSSRALFGDGETFPVEAREGAGLGPALGCHWRAGLKLLSTVPGPDPATCNTAHH